MCAAVPALQCITRGEMLSGHSSSNVYFFGLISGGVHRWHDQGVDMAEISQEERICRLLFSIKPLRASIFCLYTGIDPI